MQLIRSCTCDPPTPVEAVLLIGKQPQLGVGGNLEILKLTLLVELVLKHCVPGAQTYKPWYLNKQLIVF